MAAGFGDALEEHGFRSVSSTRYRLERDRVIFEAALYKGYSDFVLTGKDDSPPLNNFRDATVVFIPELDELAERIFGVRASEPLRNTQLQFHISYNVCAIMARELEAQMQQDAEARRVANQQMSFWRRLRATFEQEEPLPERRVSDYVPFVGEPGYQRPDYVWLVKRVPLEEVVASLSRLWRQYVWAKLSELTTLERLVKYAFDVDPDRYFSVLAVLTHHLIGDRDYVVRAIDTAQRRAHLSRADLQAELEDHGLLRWWFLRYLGVSRREMLDERVEMVLGEAEAARQIAEALGIEVRQYG